MVAVIIPCYNEERRLNVSAFQFFVQENSGYHFYFVDDGSTDKTAELLNNISKTHPSLKAIFFQQNLGKGEAIRKSVQEIKDKYYDLLAFIDADLEIPLDQLLRLEFEMRMNSNSKAAISYRSINLINTRNKIRNVGSRAFRVISKAILKSDYTIIDTQCGCKMFSSDLLKVFDSPFISEWLFDIELLLRIRKMGYLRKENISQVRLSNLNTVSEKKNYTLISIGKLVYQTIKINRIYN